MDPKITIENRVFETNRQKIIKIAAKFYEDFYTSQLSPEEKEGLQIDLLKISEIEDINLEEIEQALGMMKNNTAVSDDEIPTELIKKCDIKTKN